MLNPIDPNTPIHTTVGELEAALRRKFEEGKKHERDLRNAELRLDTAHRMACDRYINSLGNILERNQIISPVEGVRAQ